MKKINVTAFFLAVIVTLTLVASAALARENELNSGRGNAGNIGNILGKAFEKLEKFDFKAFRAEDFERVDLPSTLVINANGEVRITNGRVISMATSSLSVKVWGLMFTVNVPPEARILFASGSGGALSDVKVDDLVNIAGTTREDTPGVIQAKVIHDRSAAIRSREDEISRLRRQVEDLIRRLNELLGRTSTSTTTSTSTATSTNP